jgi:hypothetical protein
MPPPRRQAITIVGHFPAKLNKDLFIERVIRDISNAGTQMTVKTCIQFHVRWLIGHYGDRMPRKIIREYSCHSSLL